LSTILFSDELFRHNKRISKEVNIIIEMMHARIEKILRTGKSRKEFNLKAPCGDLAWIIMGAMRLVITRWRLDNCTEDPVKNTKIMLKSLKKIIYSS